MKKIFILGLLLVGFQAHAALIDQGAYTRDDVSGLDWLDLSATTGLTYANALSANSGWTLASKTQFQGLFSQFEVVGDRKFLNESVDVPGQPGTVTRLASGYTKYTKIDSGFGTNDFFDLFGVTFNFSAVFIQGRETHSLGFYDDNGAQRYGGINLKDIILPGPGVDQASVFDNFNADLRQPNGDYSSRFNIGWFLVRGPAPVSEPSIIALFVAGLFAIGFARRRQTL